jgi:hypothetical protein
MSRVFAVVLLCASLFAAGCMTTAGTPGTISVSSVPEGLNIYIDGSIAGQTPLTLQTVQPGPHTVEIRTDAGANWSSTVQVSPGGISTVSWNTAIIPTPTITRMPIVTDEPPLKGLYIQDLRGYRGGGDYITQLSFDLGSAGIDPVDMNQTSITIRFNGTTITPYWSITDRRYANINNILESGEIFIISMNIPRMDRDTRFDLLIVPPSGNALTVTRTVPSHIDFNTPILI